MLGWIFAWSRLKTCVEFFIHTIPPLPALGAQLDSNLAAVRILPCFAGSLQGPSTSRISSNRVIFNLRLKGPGQKAFLLSYFLSYFFWFSEPGSVDSYFRTFRSNVFESNAIDHAPLLNSRACRLYMFAVWQDTSTSSAAHLSFSAFWRILAVQQPTTLVTGTRQAFLNPDENKSGGWLGGV